MPCIQSTAEFPERITGPSVWDGKLLESQPDTWIYHFSGEDLTDLDAAIQHFISLDLPLTALRPETFPLTSLLPVLQKQLHNLFHGHGFGVLRGFPVHNYSRKEQAIAFMGIGSYLGEPKSQNAKGHILGHVKDLTQGSTTKAIYDVNDPTTRIYATRRAQPFHVDGTDVVGLLALSDGEEGGLSNVISSHTLYNRLQETRPDIIQLMQKPWLCDLKNEHPPGALGYIPVKPLTLCNGRVFTFWGPHFFGTVNRFPEVTLEKEKEEALCLIEKLCQEEALNMKLQVGDMQFVQNYQILHARTAYVDTPKATRHLLRLWLTVDIKQVGWEMPSDFVDPFSYNYAEHVVSLEAE